MFKQTEQYIIYTVICPYIGILAHLMK